MKLVRRTAPSSQDVVDFEPHYVWKVLVVDDEPDVRSLTRLNLKNFRFANRELEILEASSAEAAKALLARHGDIAVALIDVVMETDNAGLQLVEYIRNELGNAMVRIVIRTGQPGVAPERYVIDHYDIDDYKDKTELTAQRLYTTVRTAIKAYRDLKIIELNRRGLSRVLEVTPDIYRISSTSLSDFFEGVLTQVIGLCRLDESSFISTIEGVIATIDGRDVTIQARSDAFRDERRFATVRALCLQALESDNPAASLSGHALVLPLRVQQRTAGFIYVEPTDDLSQADRDLLQMVANQCSSALENLRLHIDLQASYEHAVDMLAEIAEFKDKNTGRHINRIDAYTRLVAVAMGVDAKEAELYGRASRLHDVGKIGIADDLLNKPGRYTPEEFAIMQQHTLIGASILGHDHFLGLAQEIALHHHERWDGKGYPEGRPSGELPLATRIVSVVDVFDALASRRPYKEPWPLDEAAAEVERGAGIRFDPAVVEAFLGLYRRGDLDAVIAMLETDNGGPA
ncbi:response regulator [Methylogaea oryzae]|uniref:Phosphodiesterase n=1 Tax=Methylogaea oryzae TaxID=1295382 RepID=A0A8D4VPN0_9GAMM|nr:response regulator [Methylogaea oryzae]BBL71750.1 phosphodiesterase [Methylogaea oryzae]